MFVFLVCRRSRSHGLGPVVLDLSGVSIGGRVGGQGLVGAGQRRAPVKSPIKSSLTWPHPFAALREGSAL